MKNKIETIIIALSLWIFILVMMFPILNIISQKLSNKAFVDKAPKNIVDQEKTNYNLLKNDIQKVRITIESL